jgi:hypothetical protein
MTEEHRSSRGIAIFGERDPAILELDVRFQGEGIIADTRRLGKRARRHRIAWPAPAATAEARYRFRTATFWFVTVWGSFGHQRLTITCVTVWSQNCNAIAAQRWRRL